MSGSRTNLLGRYYAKYEADRSAMVQSEISAIDIKKLEGEPPADGERLVLDVDRELDPLSAQLPLLAFREGPVFPVTSGVQPLAVGRRLSRHHPRVGVPNRRSSRRRDRAALEGGRRVS